MALTEDILAKLHKCFEDEPRYAVSQLMVTRWDPNTNCLSRECLQNNPHVFSHKIPDEAKPVTNQKSSGRCWIFAALNAARVPFMKSLNIDDFEFSQAQIFFWDKLERCNFFLHNVVRVARRGTPKSEVADFRNIKETIQGRLMSFLLNELIIDGGQWDMVTNLIAKYGLMPKKCFPETWSSECTTKMNRLIKSKLREFAKELWDMVHDEVVEAGEEELNKKIESQMETIYRILCICLGNPPQKFTWEYYDKSKNYQKIGPVSPLEFYEKYVKPVFNIDDKICLVSDPREENPTGKTYTVDCLGNVVGGKPTIYNNQTIETLMIAAASSIKAGEPVWFGCDVGKRFADRKGILSIDAFDYQTVFGTDFSLGLSKADRLIYGESLMQHAMVLTGVHYNNEEQNGDSETNLPLKWRVENSWGKDRSDDGYISMTNDWFREYVFEVVVDKKYLSEEIIKVSEMEPIVLSAWDPMGALAN